MEISTKKELIECLEAGKAYYWKLPADPEEYMTALVKKEAQEAKWIEEYESKKESA